MRVKGKNVLNAYKNKNTFFRMINVKSAHCKDALTVRVLRVVIFVKKKQIIFFLQMGSANCANLKAVLIVEKMVLHASNAKKAKAIF